MPDTPEYLTLKEAASAMRVTRRTVYAWIRAGKIPAKTIGRRMWIPVGAVSDHPCAGCKWRQAAGNADTIAQIFTPPKQ